MLIQGVVDRGSGLRRNIRDGGKTFLATPDFVKKAHGIEFGEHGGQSIAYRPRCSRIIQEALARRRRRVMPLDDPGAIAPRSEEHTSELQSLMRISYAVFCLKKKTKQRLIKT